MVSRPLVIIGASDFGREVAALIANINAVEKTWDFIGFVDDNLVGTTVEGFNILGPINSITHMDPLPSTVIAIANTNIRQKLATNLKKHNIPFATLVHPSVIIHDHAQIGEGSIICAGTILAINTTIGKYCILNLGCRIGHDTILKDYVSCMPGTNLAGKVIVEDRCYFGLNACVINGICIGEGSTVGAGAAVIKDLPPNVVAVGVPAKVIRRLDQ